jgi:hypothetical protein
MYKKTFIFIIFLAVSVSMYSLVSELGRKDDTITGKIVFRECYSISDILIENKYFIIFDEPWITKYMDREITFKEILISNENEEYFNGINYGNKTLKINGLLGFQTIKNDNNDIHLVMAFFIKNIELLE